MPVSIVQFAGYDYASAPAFLTLPSAPTPGNMLIYLGNDGGLTGLNPAWSFLFDLQDQAQIGAPFGVWCRIVRPGDTAALPPLYTTVPTLGFNAAAVWEIAGGAPPASDQGVYNYSNATPAGIGTLSTPNLAVPGGTVSLGIAFAGANATITNLIFSVPVTTDEAGYGSHATPPMLQAYGAGHGAPGFYPYTFDITPATYGMTAFIGALYVGPPAIAMVPLISAGNPISLPCAPCMTLTTKLPF